MNLMNLPKVQIKAFDGDPIKYHSFMALFDKSVDKVTSVDLMKLTICSSISQARLKMPLYPVPLYPELVSFNRMN